MARPKALDRDHVIRCAIHTFATGGYAGTSAQVLTENLGIGRQSLYDTFGVKWQVYVTALRRYTDVSVDRQIALLRRCASCRCGYLPDVVVDRHQARFARGSERGCRPCDRVDDIACTALIFFA